MNDKKEGKKPAQKPPERPGPYDDTMSRFRLNTSLRGPKKGDIEKILFRRRRA